MMRSIKEKLAPLHEYFLLANIPQYLKRRCSARTEQPNITSNSSSTRTPLEVDKDCFQLCIYADAIRGKHNEAIIVS